MRDVRLTGDRRIDPLVLQRQELLRERQVDTVDIAVFEPGLEQRLGVVADIAGALGRELPTGTPE